MNICQHKVKAIISFGKEDRQGEIQINGPTNILKSSITNGEIEIEDQLGEILEKYAELQRNAWKTQLNPTKLLRYERLVIKLFRMAYENNKEMKSIVRMNKGEKEISWEQWGVEEIILNILTKNKKVLEDNENINQEILAGTT